MGATQVGVIEAHSRDIGKFALLVQSFADEAASVGGDFAKIDSIETKFDIVTTTSQCGNGVCTNSTEVATTTLVGRAFKTSAGSRP